MINYSLSVHPVKVSLPNEKKVYANAQVNKFLTIDDLARHISEHNSLFDRSTIVGVIMKMVDCLREQLLLGNSVSLGELGTFRVSLKSNPTDLASEFTAQNITQARVLWRANQKFKDITQDATFQLVSTRAQQAESIKNEKADLDSQQKNDSPDDSDNPAQGE